MVIFPLGPVRKSISKIGSFLSQWIYWQSFILDLSVNLIPNRAVQHASRVGGYYNTNTKAWTLGYWYIFVSDCKSILVTSMTYDDQDDNALTQSTEWTFQWSDFSRHARDVVVCPPRPLLMQVFHYPTKLRLSVLVMSSFTCNVCLWKAWEPDRSRSYSTLKYIPRPEHKSRQNELCRRKCLYWSQTA